MRITSLFRFFLVSVFAGIVAAALILTFYREPDPVLNLVTDVGAKAPLSGPVSYAGAVNMAAPAVVNVYTTKIHRQSISPIFNDPFFRHLFGDALRGQTRERIENSLGSGVIVDSKGYIVTNNHVIADADQINVVLNDGKSLEATVVGTDPDSDIAVLKVDSRKLPTITIGDSSILQVGDVVLAIGNPFGVGQTVTMGIVSATGRNQLGINNFENFIQTDAAINPGNSRCIDRCAWSACWYQHSNFFKDRWIAGDRFCDSGRHGARYHETACRDRQGITWLARSRGAGRDCSTGRILRSQGCAGCADLQCFSWCSGGQGRAASR